ncbi:MAG TPA: Zn-ribbon domain-containing OB-fold protein [Dehalococcoidia bacterium]|nr:Zn-ribbon domain-containing OB-fold protein [Dehalococcoidia bacterium]
MTSDYAKPMPAADEDSAPFFAGAREGRLMLMRCNNCGAYRYPSRDRCDVCWSTDTAWVQASGKGAVYTFGIMHQLYHPGFKDEIPYNVAVIELAEGPRMYSNLVGVANDQIRVGMPVEVTFERISDEISLPKFRPAA